MNSKAQERLKRIANILLLNAGFTDNLGLLNGKMGIAIFFYSYSRYTGNKTYENFAGDLIDEIYSEIDSGLSVDFNNGLMGIGWGIEYLVRKGFLEADTDDILKDVDSAVFRATLKKPILIDNQNELFGFGLYYLSRLNNKEADDNDLNTIIKKQMIVYLHDDCERLLTIDKIFDHKAPDLTMNQIISVLWFINEIQRLQLFPVKLSKIERAVPVFVRKHSIASDSATEIHMFNTLINKIAGNLNDDNLKRDYEESVKRVSHVANYSSQDYITDDFVKTSFYSLLYQMPENENIVKAEFFKKAFMVIDDEENWNTRISKLSKDNLGLDGGIAGLGMAIMFGLLCQ